MLREANDPCETIESLLSDLGSMVTIDEIRAYMKQSLYRGTTLEEALAECFRGPGPDRATAAQARRFRGAAERLWSDLQEQYDRRTDEPFAVLRDKVLSYVQWLSDWVRSLDRRGLGPGDLPEQEMRALAELGGMMSGILEVLEQDTNASDDEIANLLVTLDQLEPTMKGIAEAVEAHLREESAMPIYVLKISLKQVSPPVWRRIEIPGNSDLRTLHHVIQTSMGWDDSHLHEFRVNGTAYMDPFQVDDVVNALDEVGVTLDSLDLAPKQRFTYLYDFGDNWEHSIVVERVMERGASPDARPARIRCTAGKRACPPEDCGGTFGYARLLSLMDRPRDELGPDDLEILELYAGELDPDSFDPVAVNTMLETITG